MQEQKESKSLEELVQENLLDEFYNHDSAYERYLKEKEAKKKDEEKS